MRFEISTVLERFPGANAYFVCYLPTDVALEIDEISAGLRGGFGSVRVKVWLGTSVWQTSVFKDARRESYLMLVKKSVRQAQALGEGSELAMTIELVDF